MAKRVLRRAAVTAVALLLTVSAVAYADVINADGDSVLPSAQTLIDLGTVGAGATVTYPVYFLLECRNTAHALPGTTISMTPRNPSAPPEGSISGTPTTIGPVPATWPGAGQACGTSDRFQSTTASVVTILAPMTPDTGYIYRLEYAKAPSTGVTGITTMTFRLAVSANNAPVATVPADMTVEGNALGGWLSTYSATATDAEDGPLAAPCVPAAGPVMPVGMTTVICTATDSLGATGSGSFQVTVTDTMDPVLSGVPAGLAGTTPFPAGGTVAWQAPTAVDIVDGPVAVSCAPASDSLFAVGTTTVECSASDSHGNVATGSFVVDMTLVDTTPPVLSGVPADITVDSNDQAGATVTWTAPSANDNIDGPLPVTCSPASGSLFAVGSTTVECSATDAHGNVGTGSFEVRVTFTDIEPPTLSGVPTDIWMDTSDSSGDNVGWPSPWATDDVDGPVAVRCTPASGSQFAIGTTDVNCSATDAAGNVATAAPFTVHLTLVDSAEPVISGMPSDVDVATADPAGAVVTWTAPSARDAIDGSVPVTCTPASGSRFRAGTTTVRCTASDSAGNVATRSFSVTVTVTAVPDTTPPTLSGMPANIAVVENPAGRMAITWPAPSAVDNVDGPVPVSCSPVSGWAFPVGTTTVNCSATDSAGNVARESFTVTVTAAIPDPDPEPGPAGDLDVVWSKPIGESDLYKSKVGRTIELKARISLDGAAIRKGDGAPKLVIERLTECGGEVVDRLDGGAFKGKAREWKLELKTSKLGAGCYRLSVALGDAEGGAFELMILDKNGKEKKHDKNDKHETSGHESDDRSD